MSSRLLHLGGRLAVVFFVLAIGVPGRADNDKWLDLTPARGPFQAWKGPLGDWVEAESTGLDPKNPKRLNFKPGSGIIVNGAKGRTRNLVSKRTFGDIEVHLEFLIPKGSNSGVKLEGLYEIQIYDSYGVKKPKGSDCGGIYPRAELKPKYHHIDQGFAPRTNAARPAGEWQTLDAIFQAPRFDAEGKKIANARFVKVVLNGAVIHENVELRSPTGHVWTKKEIPTGPLLLQADHGPVAFRNVRVRDYKRE
jgi:hypothetical protein